MSENKDDSYINSDDLNSKLSIDQLEELIKDDTIKDILSKEIRKSVEKEYLNVKDSNLTPFESITDDIYQYCDKYLRTEYHDKNNFIHTLRFSIFNNIYFIISFQFSQILSIISDNYNFGTDKLDCEVIKIFNDYFNKLYIIEDNINYALLAKFNNEDDVYNLRIENLKNIIKILIYRSIDDFLLSHKVIKFSNWVNDNYISIKDSFGFPDNNYNRRIYTRDHIIDNFIKNSTLLNSLDKIIRNAFFLDKNHESYFKAMDIKTGRCENQEDKV